jgi:hypothetical protein
MALKNAVEMESTLHARLHNIVAGVIIREGEEDRVRAILSNALFTTLLDMCSSGMIPPLCITKDQYSWCADMTNMVRFDVGAGNTELVPRLNFSLREMTEKVFERFVSSISRRPTSNFVRSLRAEQSIEDEDLRLDLERRGLERILRPTTATEEAAQRLTAARARMAAEVQESLKKDKEGREEVEKKEEQKKQLGFQRKIELD